MMESRTAKYIVSQLKPDLFDNDFNERYAKWAKRVLWLDNTVVDGAFQMNCSWYMKPSDQSSAAGKGHTHDCDEILGFFGSNPDNPNDLGGEIEFWLEDEKHIITKSSLVFIPKGMKHCPLIIRRVDRPIFHFSTVTDGTYVSKKTTPQNP